MNAYTIGLFVHFLGVAALFSGFAVHARAGAGLRAAASAADGQLCLRMLRATRAPIVAGSLILVGSGGHLGRLSFGYQPWMSVAYLITIVAAVLALVQVGMVSARAAKGLRVDHPALWVPIFAAIGALTGLFWLMAAKPALLESLSVVGALATLGAIAGMAAVRPSARTAGAQREAVPARRA